MKQSKYYRLKTGMKLCTCGLAIPIVQKACYGCWRRRSRKRAGRSYAGIFVRPSKWAMFDN